MNLTCEHIEERLSDYVEGALAAAERQAFEAHVESCSRCAPQVAGFGSLVSQLHGLEQLETPPRLVYNILDGTLGPREAPTGWRAVVEWLRALAAPRFVYGTASLMATILIVASATGFSWRKPRLADLRPATVYRNADRQAHLVYARSSKYVSDMRVVYEIQSRLRQDESIPSTPEETLPSTPEKTPGKTDGSQTVQPKQQNRATGLGRSAQMLAVSVAAHTELMDVRQLMNVQTLRDGGSR
ncbi:MAG TPA: zf-HC2 domain-containing protein [Candidatus Eremiobacteraceae bacterium]|nr:zf-HC2 domain-containing protein [Candidatus Eremiobacteraceae bacterium]